jgi:Flp pilus assembly protein TadD
VEELCQRAATCIKNGQYPQAQALLLAALKQEPVNENVAVAVAFVSNLAGDHDTAIAAGLHVLNKINDKSALAFREIGLAYGIKAAQARKAGDSAKAQEFGKYATGCLVKSLQINKGDKNTWEYLIAHLDGSGDREGADEVRKARQQAGV